MADAEDEYRFANIRWQSRWNSKTAPHTMLHQHGSAVMVTCLMGVLKFSVGEDEDVEAIVSQLRGTADLIEKTKRQYDAGFSAIEESSE